MGLGVPLPSISPPLFHTPPSFSPPQTPRECYRQPFQGPRLPGQTAPNLVTLTVLPVPLVRNSDRASGKLVPVSQFLGFSWLSPKLGLVSPEATFTVASGGR